MKRFCILGSTILILSGGAVADHTDQLVVVPPGTFIMGGGEACREHDQHRVTLTHGFGLGRHEVTNQEYLEAVQWAYDHGHVTATSAAVLDDLDGSTEQLLDLDGHSEISFADGFFSLCDAGHGINPHHPVKEVTWFGAARYCDWLSLQAGLPRAYEHVGDWSCNAGDPHGAQGYRLPTDAEWEYAAQYAVEPPYPWGDAPPDCHRANSSPSAPCVGWTTPVGSYANAPAALGLCDMAGNVWEWCNDWWIRSLGTAPQVDPRGPTTGTCRVFRGGSWGNNAASLQCAARGHHISPSGSFDKVGFRTAITVNATGPDKAPTSKAARHIMAASRPNPFTRLGHITYSIPTSFGSSTVLLAVYDVAGRHVRTLIRTVQHGGRHVAFWDGTDDSGRPVRTGTYFYRLNVGDWRETRCLHFIR